jgi:DNA-binding transcriptional MerR regulator
MTKIIDETLYNTIIPDKKYFNIGEVSNLTLVPKYTLRYWENEFKLLRPIRNNSGQRKYSKYDIDIVFKIKKLLYNERYTISGVKKYLALTKRRKFNELQLSNENVPNSEFLKSIKNELTYLLNLLKKIKK